jgi:hypothetical protein
VVLEALDVLDRAETENGNCAHACAARLGKAAAEPTKVIKKRNPSEYVLLAMRCRAFDSKREDACRQAWEWYNGLRENFALVFLFVGHIRWTCRRGLRGAVEGWVRVNWRTASEGGPYIRWIKLTQEHSQESSRELREMEKSWLCHQERAVWARAVQG